MPLKWKIFRVANYLLLITALAITVFVTYYFWGESTWAADEIFYFFLFVAGGIVLMANYSLNIYQLERYYPAEEPTEHVQVLIAIVLFVSCLVISLITILWCTELFGVLNGPVYDEPVFTRARIVALAFGMILLVAYYVLWMQVALRKTIRRNHIAVYTKFLESN
jgi:hypothetical protein